MPLNYIDSRRERAILLTDDDKDLHRFVWRNAPNEHLLKTTG